MWGPGDTERRICDMGETVVADDSRNDPAVGLSSAHDGDRPRAPQSEPLAESGVAVPRAPRWEPIETAPKDGTEVLVASPGRHHQPADRSYVAAARYHDGEGWYEVNNDPTDIWGGPLYPTHWMPLPLPPSPSQDR